jgi:hypothetical protein
MNKLGLNSGYIGSDQRTTTNGVVGYDKYFLERINERFNPVIEFAELLNLYSGAAAAYSLRLLRKGYAGNAIRVRRSSDNTEANIGFDSNGNLNTATLLAFSGAGNGFVTTWYDQSGNGRDATQSTAGNQPQIVSSGSVILENGKPTIQNTATTGLKTTSNVNLSTASDLSIFTVYKQTNTSESIIFETSPNFNVNGNGNILLIQNNLTFQTIQKNSSYTFVNHNNVSLNQQIVSTYLKANTTQSDFSDVYANNSILSQTNDPTLNNNTVEFANNILSLFSRNASSFGVNGNYQEFVLYTTDQILNNTAINTNINSFYNIY